MTAAPLDNTQAEFPPHGNPARARRFRLRKAAAKMLPRERVGACGCSPIGPQVDVVVGKGSAYIAGVETCGSIWHCPVCAGKIAEGRRGEVATALSGHKAQGGQIYMVTLTVPHHGYETVSILRKGVADAWRRLVSGAPWARTKARHGIEFIRAAEITHGKNGWHPHLHVLFLTNDLDDDQALDLENWLFDRWAKVTARMGLGRVSRRAFRFERADSPEKAGDYVAKWGRDAEFGVDCEVTKAHVKQSKKGGRSPWQILADAEAGDAESIFLFREYAAAMKGARHLTWSRGLKDKYQVAEETDQDLADQVHPGDLVIGSLRRVVWHRVVRAQAVPAILDAAERDGWPGVLKVLRNLKLAFPERVQHDHRTRPYENPSPESGGREAGRDGGLPVMWAEYLQRQGY